MSAYFKIRHVECLIIALGLILGGSGQSALAQSSVVCGGQVKNLYVNAAGNVYMLGTWLNTYQQICNVNSDWKAVPTTTCKSWLSLLELATASSMNVTITINATSCTSIPTYESSPPPSYVMINQ